MAGMDKTDHSISKGLSAESYSNMALVIGLVVILGTLLVPLPTIFMDVLLACSISLGIAILIVTLSSKDALELSTFPSLLLFVTLFRLSLNVASTRLILLNGNAGKIIETFGEFVAGGSLIVGLVIFIILVVIQFVVITKGAERISEVSARFTLDAMPGKQMAIDADLNAGAITEEEANRRRKKVIKESEFYGAMDGASKFIRGDAKAGLIITIVNIIGGIAIGYTKGMTVETAITTYSILAIGDGLVSQIPSIIISISSGFLVTKISSKNSMGQDLTKQFLKASEPLTMASYIIGALAFVPGLPRIPFLLLAGVTAMTGRYIAKSEKKQTSKTKNETAKPIGEQQPIEDLLDIDRISVNVGVQLISMIDPRKGSGIFDRIGSVRKRFAQQYGIIVPLVRLKDNITLETNSYEIKIFDHVVARGHLQSKMYLAMDSGNVQQQVSGIKTTEPVYGLPALWVSPDAKDAAEFNGYTVIDAESVFITHLSEVLKKHADEMLTREDTQALIDRLRKSQPSLVGEVVGEVVSIGTLQRVLKNLLRNGIPIRELGMILESLSENASRTKNIEILTEIARKSLKRTITEMYKSSDSKIYAITIEPSLEHQLLSAIQQDADSVNLSLPAETTMELSRQITQCWKQVMDRGYDKVVLLSDPRVRAPLSKMLGRLPIIGSLPVIAYDEVVAGTEVEPLETISIAQEANVGNGIAELAAGV